MNDLVSTQALVKTTADQLLQEGIKPTQQNIRDRIGRGSITTINKALNSWWQELGARFNAYNKHPNLPDSVAAIANKLWEQAVRDAEQHLHMREQELEERYQAKLQKNNTGSKTDQLELKELRAQCLRLLQENERVLDEKHQLQKSLLESENNLMALQRKFDNQFHELKQLKIMGDHEQYIEIKLANQSLIEDNEILSKRLDILLAKNIELKEK